MALTITIPGAVEATIGATAPAILTVGVGVPGATGPAGATGAQGPQGDPGEGVPVGGTAGQVLAKIDGTNYNTEWVNVEGDYLPLAGGTMDTGAQIYFPGSGGNEAVLSAESGLFIEAGDDNTTITAGEIELTFDDVALPFTIDVNGITFPDATVQTTAWNDAPSDGDQYARQDGAWSVVSAPPDYISSVTAPLAVTTGNLTVNLSTYAPLASPIFTGDARAVTAALADNDTSIATTAFVQQELASGTANARNLEVYVRNQTGSTIPIGSIVYINGATGNRPTITLAQANNDANSAQTIGFTKTAIANNGFGFVIVRGELENLNTNSLTEGVQLYLSPTTAGAYTITKPSAPQHLVYVGIVIRAHPTLGAILVSVQNGYELHELHDVALASEANNNLLAYESSTDLWKNKSFATLGLAGLNSPAFSGTPSLPTGTTGITQTAGDNTTALATTAFVTTAVPAFASVSDVLTGSSTTTAVNPLLNYVGSLNPAYFSPDVAQLSSTVTGTGSSSAVNANGYTVQLGSTAGSYATRSQTLWPNRVAVTGNLQWTRPVGFGARIAVYNRMDANAQFGISFGQATATLATPTVRSIGCYFAATAGNTPGVLVLEVHNGTTYTTVNSSYTPTFNLLFDVVCHSDGAGNVTLYVNGSQVATTSAGPSTNGGTTYQTVLQAGYKAIGTPSGTSNSVFNCLKFLTN